jgi:hypothetical protein
MKLLNFWIQPATGFTDKSSGRTDAQLDAHERRIGFRLPASYRALMKLQNGGNARFTALPDVNFSFDNYASIATEDDKFVDVTFEDYVRNTCTEEDIDAVKKQYQYCDFSRLIVFSFLNGHDVACFDYGWRDADAREEPAVIFFNDDGAAFLHYEQTGPTFFTFDEFLSSLSLAEHEAGRTYLGVESKLPYSDLIQLLQKKWLTTFKSHTDDRQGWFNFVEWYSGGVPLIMDDKTINEYAKSNGVSLEEMMDWVLSEGRVRNIHSVLSPNQHRAGTYLYSDNPELTLIIEIHKTWFDTRRAIEQLCADLSAWREVVYVVRL